MAEATKSRSDEATKGARRASPNQFPAGTEDQAKLHAARVRAEFELARELAAVMDRVAAVFKHPPAVHVICPIDRTREADVVLMLTQVQRSIPKLRYSTCDHPLSKRMRTVTLWWLYEEATEPRSHGATK